MIKDQIVKFQFNMENKMKQLDDNYNNVQEEVDFDRIKLRLVENKLS